MRSPDFNWDEYCMGFATHAATASYCDRKKVGAALFRGRQILATGFNGTLPGTPNQCECEQDGKIITNPDVIHAEQNVLLFCNREGIKTAGTTLYITLSPCNTCALLIAGAGVQRVVYLEEYRDTIGIARLRNFGIDVQHLKL